MLSRCAHLNSHSRVLLSSADPLSLPGQTLLVLCSPSLPLHSDALTLVSMGPLARVFGAVGSRPTWEPGHAKNAHCTRHGSAAAHESGRSKSSRTAAITALRRSAVTAAGLLHELAITHRAELSPFAPLIFDAALACFDTHGHARCPSASALLPRRARAALLAAATSLCTSATERFIPVGDACSGAALPRAGGDASTALQSMLMVHVQKALFAASTSRGTVEWSRSTGPGSSDEVIFNVVLVERYSGCHGAHASRMATESPTRVQVRADDVDGLDELADDPCPRSTTRGVRESPDVVPQVLSNDGDSEAARQSELAGARASALPLPTLTPHEVGVTMAHVLLRHGALSPADGSALVSWLSQALPNMARGAAAGALTLLRLHLHTVAQAQLQHCRPGVTAIAGVARRAALLRPSEHAGPCVASTVLVFACGSLPGVHEAGRDVRQHVWHVVDFVQSECDLSLEPPAVSEPRSSAMHAIAFAHALCEAQLSLIHAHLDTVTQRGTDALTAGVGSHQRADGCADDDFDTAADMRLSRSELSWLTAPLLMPCSSVSVAADDDSERETGGDRNASWTVPVLWRTDDLTLPRDVAAAITALAESADSATPPTGSITTDGDVKPRITALIEAGWCALLGFVLVATSASRCFRHAACARASPSASERALWHEQVWRALELRWRAQMCAAALELRWQQLQKSCSPSWPLLGERVVELRRAIRTFASCGSLDAGLLCCAVVHDEAEHRDARAIWRRTLLGERLLAEASAWQVRRHQILTTRGVTAAASGDGASGCTAEIGDDGAGLPRDATEPSSGAPHVSGSTENEKDSGLPPFPPPLLSTSSVAAAAAEVSRLCHWLPQLRTEEPLRHGSAVAVGSAERASAALPTVVDVVRLARTGLSLLIITLQECRWSHGADALAIDDILSNASDELSAFHHFAAACVLGFREGRGAGADDPSHSRSRSSLGQDPQSLEDLFTELALLVQIAQHASLAALLLDLIAMLTHGFRMGDAAAALARGALLTLYPLDEASECLLPSALPTAGPLRALVEASRAPETVGPAAASAAACAVAGVPLPPFALRMLCTSDATRRLESKSAPMRSLAALSRLCCATTRNGRVAATPLAALRSMLVSYWCLLRPTARPAALSALVRSVAPRLVRTATAVPSTQRRARPSLAQPASGQSVVETLEGDDALPMLADDHMTLFLELLLTLIVASLALATPAPVRTNRATESKMDADVANSPYAQARGACAVLSQLLRVLSDGVGGGAGDTATASDGPAAPRRALTHRDFMPLVRVLRGGVSALRHQLELCMLWRNRQTPPDDAADEEDPGALRHVEPLLIDAHGGLVVMKALCSAIRQQSTAAEVSVSEIPVPRRRAHARRKRNEVRESSSYRAAHDDHDSSSHSSSSNDESDGAGLPSPPQGKGFAQKRKRAEAPGRQTSVRSTRVTNAQLALIARLVLDIERVEAWLSDLAAGLRIDLCAGADSALRTPATRAELDELLRRPERSPAFESTAAADSGDELPAARRAMTRRSSNARGDGSLDGASDMESDSQLEPSDSSGSGGEDPGDFGVVRTAGGHGAWGQRVS